MELRFTKSFLKEIKRCPLYIQKQTNAVLSIAENASNINEVPGCQELKGKNNKGYYKIRVGDWRIGLKYENNKIHILHVLTIEPRGDIYKNFPPK